MTLYDTTLVAESEAELKSLLKKMKEESEKAVLKFNIPKTKIMASGLITSWQINGGKVEIVTYGEKVETVINLFSWAPKSLWMVTAVTKIKDIFSLEERLWQA